MRIVTSLTRSVMFHCVEIRDGKPGPYGDVRSCAIVPIEFLGEALRLPARSTGGQYVHGSLRIVTACASLFSVRKMPPQDVPAEAFCIL